MAKYPRSRQFVTSGAVLVCVVAIAFLVDKQHVTWSQEDSNDSAVDALSIGFSHGPIDDGMAAFLVGSGTSRFIEDEPIHLLFGLLRVPVRNADNRITEETLRPVRVIPPSGALNPGTTSWFEVTRADGVELKYRGVSFSNKPIELTAENTSQLYPGGIVGGTTVTPLDLASLFDVAPGKYSVTWHYSTPFEVRGKLISDVKLWAGDLESNSVSFEVVAKR